MLEGACKSAGVMARYWWRHADTQLEAVSSECLKVSATASLPPWQYDAKHQPLFLC